MKRLSKGQRAHLLELVNASRSEPRIIGEMRLYEKTVPLWSFCLKKDCAGHASCVECIGAWCDWYRRKNGSTPADRVLERRRQRVEMRLRLVRPEAT